MATNLFDVGANHRHRRREWVQWRRAIGRVAVYWVTRDTLCVSLYACSLRQRNADVPTVLRHFALDSYRAILPDAPGFLAGAGAEDDFPF